MPHFKTHCVALLIALSLAGLARAQVVTQAPTVESLLDKSFHAMYNLRFDEALAEADRARSLDRADPTPWVAQASAILFREFDRLHILRSEMFASDAAFDARPASVWVEGNRRQFDDALSGAEKIARQRLGYDKNDLKGLFALTLVNGLRADDAALITKKNLTALSYTKSATGFAEKLLALAPDYYDAYVATGVGKYIIGGKPAPVRWMLRIGGLKGDQEAGIRELRLVADHGHYLAPFARILLAFDDLRHKNRNAARQKLEGLREQFPGNPLFAREIQKFDQPAP